MAYSLWRTDIIDNPSNHWYRYKLLQESWCEWIYNNNDKNII